MIETQRPEMQRSYVAPNFKTFKSKERIEIQSCPSLN